MDVIRRMYLSILLFIILVEVTGSDFNETTQNGERGPRAAGRIVKLYSGPRPEPIVCTAEGFRKDPYNCAVFYRCVMSGNGKYTVFRFQCGPGTIYDPDTEVCNHPRSTKRSECGGYISPVADTTHINEIESLNNEVPSPIINNKPIYATDTEISAMTTEKVITSSSTQFTMATNTYPWGSNSHIYPEYSMTVNTFKPTPPQQIFTDNSNIPHSNTHDNTCTSDGFMGDTENCRKFYRCVANEKGGYTRYEFMCTETTIWDEDYQICNHIWAVKRSRCGRQSNGINEYNTPALNKKPSVPNKDVEHTIMENDSNSSIQQQLQISYGSKVTQIQTQISNGSVVQNQTQIHIEDRNNDIKDENNRQNQTQVNYGSAVSQSQTQINYGSQGIQTQLQVDHSKEASQTQVQIIGSPILDTSTSNIFTKREGNSSDCTDIGFIGDSQDCHKFYRCVDNGKGGYSKISFSCAEGTVWDQSILACNHAWAVKECGLKDSTVSMHPITNTKEETSQNTATYTTTSTENYSENLDSVDSNDENGYITQRPSHTFTSSPTSTTAIPSHVNDKGNSECNSSGFMGDNNNCKIFYRCVESSNGGFIKYEFKCGEGTVWDPQIEACNHAWAVEKCGGNAFSDISKLETTTNTLSTSTSIFTQSTAVSHIIPEKDQNDGDEHLEPGYGPSNDGTSMMNTSLKPTQIVNENNFVCISEGFIGDKNNCEKFYRCIEDGKGGFTRYEFACSKGTLWDDTIGACNHASAVNRCGDITTDPLSEEPVDTSSSESIRNTTTLVPNKMTTTIKPLSLDSSKCTESGFLKDPKYCNKFYRCIDDGKGGFMKHVFSCGEGTYWNQAILSCEHITSDNECGQRVFDTTTKQPQYQYEDTFTTITPKNESYLTQPKPAISSGICTSEGFYGDKNDCKKFYRCVDNGSGRYTKYDFACRDGTIWDQAIQACNHNAQSKCLPSISGDLPSLRPPLAEPPLSTDQTQHVSALTTSEKNEIQPQITEKYEPNTSGYIPQSEEHINNQGPPLMSTNDVCLREGYYGNKNNCKEFYRCVDNGQGGYTKYSFICSEGTAWDSNIQGCNYIEHVTSCQGSVLQNEDNTQTTHASSTTSRDPKTSTTSQPNFETMSTTTTQKASSIFQYDSETSPTTLMPKSSTTSKPISGNNSDKSKCENEGFFGDSQDCKKFYRCVDNGDGRFTKYNFDCAEGTIWDQDVMTCNHPENVVNPSCNKTQNSNTVENSSSASSNSNISSSTQNQNPENNKFKCTKAGFYPNPDNCKKFYRCVDWDGNGTRFSIYHFECGEGTIWDPVVETCNHEGSVYPPRDCSGSQNQGDNHTSTTENSTTQKETITESTTQTTTESISESTIQTTTQSTTQSETQATTYSSSQSATQSTTQSTTQPASPSTIQSTTTVTTQPTPESTIKSTTQQITESTTSTPTGQITSTTETITSTITDKPNESTTETTTESVGQSTTEQVTEATSTTQEESTTKKPEEITTEKSEQTTTEKLQETTTEKKETTTTEKSQETTTEKKDTTTTEKFQESTTEKLGESTTDQSQVTTTEKLEESTTEKPGENITEQTQSTTEQTGASTTEATNPTTQETETSTTEQSTTEYTTTETAKDKNSTDGKCPETEKDQNMFVCPSSFRRHPKYCNLFYQCDENEDTHDVKIAMFTCPNNTIYDQTQIKCVEERKAEEKCAGEIAQKRRFKRKGVIEDNYPIVVTKDSFACLYSGYFMFEKNSECSPGFLKCVTTKSNKLRGFVYQCPTGYIFWSVSRRCEPIAMVSDCKRSYINDWSRRWAIPIESKNVHWS